MEVVPKTIVSLYHIFLVHLVCWHFLQSMGLAQVFLEEGVRFFHCSGIVALRVTIEVVWASTGGLLDLPERDGDPSGPMPKLSSNFIYFPTTDTMCPGISTFTTKNHKGSFLQISIDFFPIISPPVHD